MANTKSAKKAMRVSERRRLRNKPIRTAIRTYIKTAAGLIVKNDDGAPESLASGEASRHARQVSLSR